MDGLTAVLWLLAALLGGGDHDPECLVLGGLDLARAQAFVEDDEARLSAVYTDVRAARTDLRVLRSYREHGLRLEGMLIIRESCRVVRRAPRRVTLEVVDRLGPSSVTSEGDRELDLPRDRPTRRTVVLERPADAWRVGSVATPRR